MKKMLSRTTKAGFLDGETNPGEILVPNKLFANLDIYLKNMKNVFRVSIRIFKNISPVGRFLL